MHSDSLLLSSNGSVQTSQSDSPASFPKSTFYAKTRIPSFLDLKQLHQPVLDQSGKDSTYSSTFRSTLEDLWIRTDELFALEDENSSPVRTACCVALRTCMPHFLQRVSMLLERLEETSQSESDTMVAKLRLSFALLAAVQLLDTIESGLNYAHRESLDEKLGQILNSMRESDLGWTHEASFRVSHWVAPSRLLAFDVPVGCTATVSLEGDHKSMPLSVEVEPVYTVTAQSLVEEKKDIAPFRLCSVQMEKCTHSALEFAEGAGTIGVAVIQAHVTPLDRMNSKICVWGREPEVEKLRIKEARAVQLNAFPPKPRAGVDLYTSHIYGDAGISVTMIIKTCETYNKEPPKLHIELILA